MATSTRRGTGATGSGWTDPSLAYDAGSATYATSTAGSYPIDVTGYGFDADIGSGDTLVSTQVTVKQYESSLPRFDAPTVQAYNGSTALGSPVSLTESTNGTNSQTVSLSGVTLSDIRSTSFKIRFTVNKTGSQSSTAYLYYCDVIATYNKKHAATASGATSTTGTATAVVKRIWSATATGASTTTGTTAATQLDYTWPATASATSTTTGTAAATQLDYAWPATATGTSTRPRPVCGADSRATSPTRITGIAPSSCSVTRPMDSTRPTPHGSKDVSTTSSTQPTW